MQAVTHYLVITAGKRDSEACLVTGLDPQWSQLCVRELLKYSVLSAATCTLMQRTVKSFAF